MALANMTQAETNEYNRKHCMEIADRLDAIAHGDMYMCPECGEWNSLEEIITEYIIGANDHEYRGCKICVAWGGPSIYIDTCRGEVALYWWGDNARYDLSTDAVNALDECMREFYECGN